MRDLVDASVVRAFAVGPYASREDLATPSLQGLAEIASTRAVLQANRYDAPFAGFQQ